MTAVLSAIGGLFTKVVLYSQVLLFIPLNVKSEPILT